MEVIGAGWGRTGTLSLKEALETLGLPCYHMLDAILTPGHHMEWLAAAQGEAVDLQQLLAGYKACVDWPAASFYRQLMELYPEAKVILSVRDPAKWYESVHATIFQLLTAVKDAPSWVQPLLPLQCSHIAMTEAVVWDGDLQGSVGTDPARAQALFTQHIEEVKAVVPPERLLVFEVRQGWGPLCAFLGKPVPEGKPFPHVNDTAAMQARRDGIRQLVTLLTWGVPAAAAAVAVGAALLLRRVARPH